MLALAASGSVAEGDWLIADAQTAGRGRMGRGWASPPGNLYASLLVMLRPTDPQPATLALVAAVALVDTLRIWVPGHRLAIKWPNDVLAGGAKLSGILLERGGDAVVAGFGVNQLFHPPGLDRPATSIAALAGTAPDPATVLDALAETFTHWLVRWRGEGLAPVRAAWLDRAHPVGTALSAALPDGHCIDGLFDGLTDDCALRLRLADGSVRVIHAGDVFLI